MTAYQEAITKAAQTAALLRSDIRDAFRDAGPVECIVIERLLSQVAEAERDLIRLKEAAK